VPFSLPRCLVTRYPGIVRSLSLRALNDFTLWFLKICLDQVQFMSLLFATEALAERLKRYVAQNDSQGPGFPPLSNQIG